MEIITILLIAIGLAMDAFAVSICKGLAMKTPSIKAILVICIWFGTFQALMPVIGYYLGSSFYEYISEYDHWIAFGLLALIGVNMIRESLGDEDVDESTDIRTMFILAVATSIDALAVGISMAMEGTGIEMPAIIIGVITFTVSAFGVIIGNKAGDKLGGRAEFIGGTILIVIGLKILFQHLGFI